MYIYIYYIYYYICILYIYMLYVIYIISICYFLHLNFLFMSSIFFIKFPPGIFDIRMQLVIAGFILPCKYFGTKENSLCIKKLTN